MLLERESCARAGLLGNPSDGYYGKTVAFTFEDFRVVVTMYESPELQFLPGDVDDATFTGIDELVDEIHHFGYYGGIRLMKATTKVFAEHCRERDIRLPRRNFTVRYRSEIPRLVGLGGSSAICTAMFKSLTAFYEVEVPLDIMPTLCWHAESQELGIQCGLQDRVVQVYDGTVYMDFERAFFEANQHGRYEPIAREQLPNLYVAYDPARAEFSGTYHRRLRALFEAGEGDIMEAMSEFADMAEQGCGALRRGDHARVAELINANFDLRRRVFPLNEANVRMVMLARGVGASAKFAGSGGAIVGTYEHESMYRKLCECLGQIGCKVIRPRITSGLAERTPMASDGDGCR